MLTLHYALSCALVLGLLSCKSSGNGDKGTPPAGVDQDPTALGATDPLWAAMRNDCGGTQHVVTSLLGQLGTPLNRVSDTHNTISIGGDSDNRSFQEQGSGQAPVDATKCAALHSYVDLTLKKWAGQNYQGSVEVGDYSAFKLGFELDFKPSVKAQAIKDITNDMLAPAVFPANQVTTELSLTINAGSTGVVLVQDLPVQLNCKVPLSYQYSIYGTDNPDASASCRARTATPTGKKGECAVVTPFICAEKLEDSGRCPGGARLAMDGCSFLVKNLPLLDFTGTKLGTANIGGFLRLEGKDAKQVYRLQLQRVELN